MKTDVLIIGAGPAGIFTALELIRKGYKGHITLVEKGQSVEKRHCPKAETGRCMNVQALLPHHDRLFRRRRFLRRQALPLP